MFRTLLRTTLPLTAALLLLTCAAMLLAPRLPGGGTIIYGSTVLEQRYAHDVALRVTIHHPENSSVLPTRPTSWASDYNTVLFRATPQLLAPQLWLMDVSGGVLPPYTAIQPLAAHLTDAVFYALSPDGAQIAYVRNNAIWIRSIETGEEWLAHSLGQNLEMDWSPDGKTLLFRSRRQMHDEVYLLDLDTRRESLINTHSIAKFSPTFSPNGRYAAYVANGVTADDIYVTDLTTGDYWPVTNGGFNYQPQWSPDGTQLVFVMPRSRSQGNTIAIADMYGERIRHVSTRGPGYNYPVWLP